MKKILFLIALLITMFTKIQSQENFNDRWKEVTAFEKKGLPKSAIDVVQSILEEAKKDKNTNQIIKALLYQSKYLMQIEEESQLKVVANFKNIIEKSKAPQKNILQSVLANLYWQYFKQNRWKFYNRTKTAAKINNEDFRSWDLETLFHEIHCTFEESLRDKEVLQQEKLQDYNILLKTVEGSKEYRPTLFDLLAHQALDFYKTPENAITKPADAFELSEREFLAPHPEFEKLKLQTTDTTSLQFKALELYQELTRFHQDGNRKKPLIDLTVERLRFVWNNSVFPTKDEIFLQSLQKEKTLHQKTADITSFYFEEAKLYQEQARQFQQEKDSTYQWHLKKAVETCKKAMALYPDSNGAKNCQKLTEDIQTPSVHGITTTSYNPVNQPTRLLISYTNVDNLFIKIYKIDPKLLSDFRKKRNDQDKIAFIKTFPEIDQLKVSLTNEKDFQEHTTEKILPGLPQGMYFITASQSDTLTGKNYAYGTIQFTDIALSEYKSGTDTKFRVSHRVSGAPLTDATLNLTSDNRRRERLTTTLTTDNNGIAVFSQKGSFSNIRATIVHKDKEAHFGGLYSYQNYQDTPRNEESVQKHTYLFTDRSIYRPGQTVYFKGISFSAMDGKNQKVIAGENHEVALIDVNGQEVAALTLSSNEFGSFNGTFIVPESGLTGLYTLQGPNNSYHSISVEAYKRPKFLVSFDPVTDAFQLNQNISVNGKALGYAGSSVSGSKVVYRVTRKVRYPIWCYWRPAHTSKPQEIAQGETTTDENGQFTIDFKAIPDKTVSKKNQPVFTYEVVADVTDSNGETRSADTFVKVGYHTITATLNTPDNFDLAKKEFEISVSTQNLNDQPVANSGTITISKLQEPDRIFIDRNWPAPDYPGIPKAEFVKNFPHVPYQDENNYKTWEKEKEMYNGTYHTQNTDKGKDSLKITTKNWTTGLYVVELQTKDTFGQSVKDVTYVKVTNTNKAIKNTTKILEIISDKKVYQPGEDVNVTLTTALDYLNVIVHIQRKNEKEQIEFLDLTNKPRSIKIPVTENDLGRLNISYSYIALNRFNSGTKNIDIPYPKADLTITAHTFRDKIKPGNEETWNFTITGPKGEAVTAEVLASMYDMSLDQFKDHDWQFQPIVNPYFRNGNQWSASMSFGADRFVTFYKNNTTSYLQQNYDRLNWFGFSFGNSQLYLKSSRVMMMGSGVPKPKDMQSVTMEEEVLDEVSVSGYGVAESEADSVSETTGDEASNKETLPESDIPVRSNLQETAFFFSQLTTNSKGEVSFSFSSPEALTRWKLQLLAHTKTLQSATASFETITQKELMVLPNMPRFLRQGDQITVVTKISNLSETVLNGKADLILTDPFTNLPITLLDNDEPSKSFTVTGDGNTSVSWNLRISDTINALQYKIVAKAGNFSDGEQGVLPVVTNRKMVTETLPMWIESDQSKTFVLDKLQKNTSKTLKNHQLTLEITSNPTWYAVQALPYLQEINSNCSEQVFSRYYANALGKFILAKNPRIQQVFSQWKNSDALLSALEKNQELKSLLIDETPWLRDAESESEQKKRIALLFETNTLQQQLKTSLEKLERLQYNSGAFPWFEGGLDNRFITQHIVAGFGRLQKLGAITANESINMIITKAIQYLDRKFLEEYDELKALQANDQKNPDTKDHLSYQQLHYMYMRSYFKQIAMPSATKKAWAFYLNQAETYWLEKSLYAQGLLSLILHRNQKEGAAREIVASLKERSVVNEELGRYWKDNQSGWYWYQAPVETQSLLIEVFDEVYQGTDKTALVDQLKIWLLKNKQTNRWATTKATTDAIYALLSQGSDWLAVTDLINVQVGNKEVITNSKDKAAPEAGTGYFKTTWPKSEITSKKAKVTLTKKGKGIAWGALYWQYFEDLDKISETKTNLKLDKKLFLKTNTASGPVLTQINDKKSLEIGDLVTVRIVLQNDRTLQFVHMKDMRASALEPTTVLSGYKYQDGLGYYQSVKDLSTDFFFDYLPKGTFVFEYNVRVTNSGNFSNGITTIQSMYAPELSSHSKGIRIQVKK